MNPIKKLSNRHQQYILAYALILPSFILLAMFTYLPIVRSFVDSLYQKASGNVNVFAGLANYKEVLSSSLFGQVVKNTLIYSACTIIPAVVLGLFYALMVNKKVPGRGFIRFSLFYPSMIPISAASMVWMFMFSRNLGIINKILDTLNMNSTIDWLNSDPHAMIAIIIVAVWKLSGYYMLLFISGLQSIDDSYYEVAYLNGATPWQRFRLITFPMLTPTTFFVVLMAFINSLQSIDQVYAMTSGGPYNATNVILYYIYQNGFVFWNTGYASTASMLLFIVLLILTAVYYFGLQRFINYER